MFFTSHESSVAGLTLRKCRNQSHQLISWYLIPNYFGGKRGGKFAAKAYSVNILTRCVAWSNGCRSIKVSIVLCVLSVDSFFQFEIFSLPFAHFCMQQPSQINYAWASCAHIYNNIQWKSHRIALHHAALA